MRFADVIPLQNNCKLAFFEMSKVRPALATNQSLQSFSCGSTN